MDSQVGEGSAADWPCQRMPKAAAAERWSRGYDLEPLVPSFPLRHKRRTEGIIIITS